MGQANSSGKNLVLSTEQVVTILKASARCRVSVLKFRDLYVKFDSQVGQGRPLPGTLQQHAFTSPVAEMTDIQHQQSDLAALEQSELELREQELEELKITNPVRYEELVNEGELEENDERPRDDDTE